MTYGKSIRDEINKARIMSGPSVIPRNNPNKDITEFESKESFNSTFENPEFHHPSKLQFEINKIHNIDCIQGLSQMPDNSVDLTITSPPYNLGKRGNKNLYTNYDDNLSEMEYYNFISIVITELIRVTRKYVFFNFQILSDNKNSYLKILSDFRLNIKDIIIWHKDNAVPHPNGCLSSKFEFIIVFTKEDFAKSKKFEFCNFQNRYLSNIIQGPNASSDKFKKVENKAVFPRYLPRWFIKNFAQEGDLILDPFAGSNTTGKVAKENGFNYIGFEINKDYIDKSEDRTAQSSLIKLDSQLKL